MGWDGAVWGRLELPPEQVEAWLAAEARREDHAGWPDFFDAEGVPRTVEALLAELENLAVDTPGFLEVRRHENRVEVQGFMSKDALLDSRLALTLPFLAAAALGAKGELVVMGARTAWFGYRLTVGGGQGSWKVLSDEEIHAAERSVEYQAIDARLESVLESLVGSTAGRTGPNPFIPPPSVPRPPAKKPAAKKAPAKKSPAKKAATKARTAKKSAPAKSSRKTPRAKAKARRTSRR
ncbi:MAG: hypothetical protein K1X89_29380 [Myxococcaceae bacterium]|nr:hypothetical protein [Myxococcaceae bacterium]